MTIFFVLFKCIGNCTYWYYVNYSNTARCVIARVLYAFIFGFTDNTLLGGIQIQHLGWKCIKECVSVNVKQFSFIIGK